MSVKSMAFLSCLVYRHLNIRHNYGQECYVLLLWRIVTTRTLPHVCTCPNLYLIITIILTNTVAYTKTGFIQCTGTIRTWNTFSGLHLVLILSNSTWFTFISFKIGSCWTGYCEHIVKVIQMAEVRWPIEARNGQE